MTAVTSPRVLAGALALLAAGCVSPQAEVQGTEQMLAAAGFRPQPASTPAQQNQLLLLPSYRLVGEPVPGGHGREGYLYADPDYCRCVWTGDAAAYQAFARLAWQQRLADEQMQAAELYAPDPFGWDTFGPPVIVEHGHEWHDHDRH